MVCWKKFINLVSQMTGVSERDSEEILKDIEDEVGHDENLIKAIVDIERDKLTLRLKKKKKKKEQSIAYV